MSVPEPGSSMWWKAHWLEFSLPGLPLVQGTGVGMTLRDLVPLLWPLVAMIIWTSMGAGQLL